MGVFVFLKFDEFDPAKEDHTCIAITSRKKRCRNHVYGRPRIDIARLQEAIIQLSPDGNAYNILLAYAKRNLCVRHNYQLLKINDLVLQWAKEIDEQYQPSSCTERSILFGRPMYYSVSDAVCTALKVFGEWKSTQATYRMWDCQPTKHVQSLLLSPLDDRDRKSGTIYILSKEGTTGYLKIGMTTRTAYNRSVQLKHQCGYEAKILLSIPNIPCARRVEQLIFTELKTYRRQEISCRCGVEHSEWFQVDIGLAEATIRHWSSLFTRIKFYDDIGFPEQAVADTTDELEKEGRSVNAQNLEFRLNGSCSLNETQEAASICNQVAGEEDYNLEVDNSSALLNAHRSDLEMFAPLQL